MDYPAYPVYRESGIEWLGKIPDHWEVRRLKFVAEIQNGRDYKEVESSEGYPVFGSGGVFRFATEYLYDGESVLFGRKGTIDKPLYVNEKFWTVDTMFYSVILEQTHGRFLYFFATTLQFNLLATQTALPSITQTDLGNYLISYPTYQEQQTIAQFLDYKTQQIDQLIAKKRTLIDRLNEQRIALITHAVTKGLNPAVTLKDSGVEWLGKVPKHWEISKLGYFSESLQTGPFGSQIHAEEYIDGGIPLINPAEIINGILRYNPRVTVDYATAERLKRHQLMEGDIVIARRGEMGRAGLTKKENVGWLCGTGSLRARLETEKLMPEYLLQLFSLSGTADYLSLQSVGSTMDNLNTSILNQLPIIVPPIEEQREIEAYLDKETARIDQMVGINQQTIDKLKEYRTALITAAVTGKIDLRNWQQEANHANP